MTTVIYDDELGARTTKIFGCSFKSITAQMGFNSQPTVFTVTIVEENDQDFILNQNDIRSVQRVTFGELSILGIVQSWEKTTVDPNGTGIYVVRLIDCRMILDSMKIVNLSFDLEGIADVVQETTMVKLSSDGCTTTTRIRRTIPGLEEIHEEGATFGRFISYIENTTINYGDDVFEVDMSELRDLTNSRGEGIDTYYIEGKIRSLVSTITEFCNAVGAEWWVESHRKSVVDNTIVIKIKIIRRLDGIDNPNALEMDELAAMHNDRVLLRKDGYELNDTVTNVVIWGGMKQTLQLIHGVGIKPFWGFDESGEPLLSPSYLLPGEPISRRINTTVEEMENALNGNLDDNMDTNQLIILKRYIDNFWGRKFYFVLSKNMLSESGEDLPFYPEINSIGWWEGDGYPIGTRSFDQNTLMKITTEDGRWGPFVRLPKIFLTGSGTVESPVKTHYVTWSQTVQNSSNLILAYDESYMQCKIEQYSRYVVITLPTNLTRCFMDPETGQLNRSRLTCEDELSRAWIPLKDRGIHYGPWGNTSLAPNRTPLPGRSEVSIDRSLVPWVFGVRGILHQTAMEQLSETAMNEINTLPNLPVINTGQLEVAGIPQVNIGQAVGLGGSITEIFIRFDNNGVTTRYVMDLFTRELGEFKRQKAMDRQRQKESMEKETNQECPIKDEDEEKKPEPEPIPEEEFVLSQEATEYIWGHPEGGMGIITGKDGGPYYSIKRTSHLDLSPWLAEISAVFGASAWSNVRNLAEPLNSPGLLPVGTHVTVNIFSEQESGPYIPYIEQTPQVFSPPPLPT